MMVVCTLATGKLAGQARPNMVYIVADDMGWGDVGCYGNTFIPTPSIDKLAAGGALFTQAYAAAPVCTPSRTAFVSGRYPARTPVGLREPLDWNSPADSLVGITPDIPSIAMQLKQAGYSTHLTGKWHLGFGPRFSPLVNGFDSFFGFYGGGVDYTSHTDPYGNIDLYLNDKPQTVDGYLTDLLARDAVSFITSCTNQPFFLSVQFSAPHWPWQDAGAAPYPQSDAAWKEGGSKEIYGKMLASMDSAVGTIMHALLDANLGQNTLVIFTSDNGGERFSDMGGLKEKKMQLWEGGIRVPAIVYWPRQVPAGIISRQPVINMDWTATMLALSGAKQEANYTLDGINLLPFLKRNARYKPRTFYWRVHQRRQQYAMREGDWKYLKTETQEYLFNLKDDPYENVNLMDKYPRRVLKMKSKYEAWENTMLMPVPLPGK